MRLSLAMCLVVSGIGAPVHAAPAQESAIACTHEVLDRSAAGVRIYRSTSRRGTPILVLTNLDSEGNPLCPPVDVVGAAPEDSRIDAGTRAEDASSPAGPVAASGETSGSGAAPVTVVVSREGDAAPGDEPEVMVTSDAPGKTTVIVNIHPPARPAGDSATALVPLDYPVVFIGGLPGPSRYPAHLPFLGYGTDVSSPSWFGGLGLNAGNGFGLKTGVPCGRGFDCMFGPATHP